MRLTVELRDEPVNGSLVPGAPELSVLVVRRRRRFGARDRRVALGARDLEHLAAADDEHFAVLPETRAAHGLVLVALAARLVRADDVPHPRQAPMTLVAGDVDHDAAACAAERFRT